MIKPGTLLTFNAAEDGWTLFKSLKWDSERIESSILHGTICEVVDSEITDDSWFSVWIPTKNAYLRYALRSYFE